MTRKERAYSFMDLGVKSARSGLDNMNVNEVTDELLIGAFAGTALAAVTLFLLDKKISKKLIQDKINLDQTYSPIQRTWSKELEKMNKNLLLRSSIGSVIGSLAGYQISISAKNKYLNEAVGTSLGNRLGKSITDIFMHKKIKEYKQLLLEYEDSLSLKQKELRLELTSSLKRTGLIWSIGCIGGLVLGATIGNSIKNKLN